MFNIAGFHIPKQVAFKHQGTILEKVGWDHPGLKPLGHEKRLYTKALNAEDEEKQEEYKDCDREEYLGKNDAMVEIFLKIFVLRFNSGGAVTVWCAAAHNDGGWGVPD